MMPPRRAAAEPQTLVLSAALPPLRRSVGELWAHRELVFFLAWRDVQVRYKQAAFGVAWAVLRPLLLMVLFSFFNRVAQIETGGVPYPVFAFLGLALWTYFSSALVAASDSLVASSNLVTKTYFPRLTMPLAAVLGQLPDLLISLLLLAPLMLVYQVGVGVPVLLLPALVALLVLVTFALGVWLSAVNVSYRDVKHAVPFLVQVGLFVTPVLYRADVVSPKFQLVYGLNPLAGIIELARWSVFGTDLPSLGLLAVSMGVSVVTLLVGVRYFRRAEVGFADVI